MKAPTLSDLCRSEECAKALVVYLFIWKHPAFDEHVDVPQRCVFGAFRELRILR